MEPEKKFDMVFSHSVVDHVYDPVKFIENIVNLQKNMLTLVIIWVISLI